MTEDKFSRTNYHDAAIDAFDRVHDCAATTAARLSADQLDSAEVIAGAVVSSCSIEIMKHSFVEERTKADRSRVELSDKEWVHGFARQQVVRLRAAGCVKSPAS